MFIHRNVLSLQQPSQLLIKEKKLLELTKEQKQTKALRAYTEYDILEIKFRSLDIKL